MWNNYLKIALRNLWKQRGFSLINILGLAIGMACCFLIVQFAWHESNYDRFHPNLDRLYRISYHINFNQEAELARIPPAFITQFEDHFPEIEYAARMYPRNVSVLVNETDRQFEVEQVYFADSNITQIFHFDFLAGDPETALDQPFSVVLTDEMAQSFFGRTNVLGEQLQLADAPNFKVTGVIRDWPDQAHLKLSLLVPYRNMVDLEPPHARDIMRGVLEQNWMASHSYTYVTLNPGHHPEAVNEKFKDYIQKFGDENIREKQDFSLFPVRDIHLHSTQSLEARTPTSLSTLYLFIAIGLISLLIACINFINLSTAGSLTRAREVGVRKVMGATRGALIRQFLGESVVLSFFAFLISLFLARLALPHLNSLTGLELDFALLQNPVLLLAFIGIFLLAGLLAGAYPALFVSRFKAIYSLKGGTQKSNKPGAVNLRKALITVQFLATIVFVSGVLIMYLQLDYLRNRPLGFQKELMLQLPIDSGNNLNTAFRPGDATMRQRMNTLDEQLLSSPNIKAVTQCNRVPGFGAIGRPVWNDQVLQEDAFTAQVNSVDYDYAETFGLQIIAGRDFDISYGTDHINSFIVNEKAVMALQWDSPEDALGQRLVAANVEGKVVGVVKDYHFSSLYSEINPLILRVAPGDFTNYAIRLENANIAQSLSFIESKWKEFFPGKAFEYSFLDESMDDFYNSEQRLLTIVAYFALIAIFISCFGLFGLAALVTQQRFKEIGIRKVLGATAFQIVQLLSRDFLRLISLAMVLAIPLIWYFSKLWMEEFAFRIGFPWWVPLVIGIGVILLAFLTISTKTYKAAIANPVDSIRSD